MAVSNKAWSQFSAADYTPAQWFAATLIHLAGALVPARAPPGIVTVVGGVRWGTVRITRLVAGAETRGAAVSTLFVPAVRIGTVAPAAFVARPGVSVSELTTFARPCAVSAFVGSPLVATATALLMA